MRFAMKEIVAAVVMSLVLADFADAEEKEVKPC